jgi:hypothetical protein
VALSGRVQPSAHSPAPLLAACCCRGTSCR